MYEKDKDLERRKEGSPRLQSRLGRRPFGLGIAGRKRNLRKTKGNNEGQVMFYTVIICYMLACLWVWYKNR